MAAGGSGLMYRPPASPAMMGQGFNGAPPSGGLRYRPPGLSPLRQTAVGGLAGLGQLLMALGAGRPEQAGQAFASGVESSGAQQRQNAADYQNNLLFDLGMEDRETGRADKAADKEAAAAAKRERDAAIDGLVASDVLDAAEGQAMKSDVGKLGDFTEKPKDGPAGVQEYEYAVKHDGYKGSFIDFQLAQKKAGASSSTTNVTVAGESGADANQRKFLSEAEGKRWSELKGFGTAAGSMSQDFQVLDELIQVAPQGPVQGRLAEAFPGFSSAGDAFQSVVKRVAPSLRVPGSGATSDIEYEGMLQSLPQLRVKPEGNRAIVEMMKAKAAINVERANIITQFENEDITAKAARAAIAELDSRSIMSPELKAAIGGLGVDTGGPKVVKELPAGFE